MVPESTINQAVSGVRKIKAKKQRANERSKHLNDLRQLREMKIVANSESWMVVQYGAAYQVRCGNYPWRWTSRYDYAIKELKRLSKNKNPTFFESRRDCLRREND